MNKLRTLHVKAKIDKQANYITKFHEIALKPSRNFLCDLHLNLQPKRHDHEEQGHGILVSATTNGNAPGSAS